MGRAHILAAACVLLLQACSGQDSQPPAAAPPATPPVTTAPAVVADMLATMGGQAALEAVQTLVHKGGGWRMHLGQIPATGAPEPRGELSELVETIDLANSRAAFNNLVQIGEGFTQRRTEAYTVYKGQRLGWGTTEGRPNMATSVNGLFSWATHNTPELLLRRNVVAIALAAAGVTVATPLDERDFDGSASWYLDVTLGTESVGLYIDQTSKRLLAWSALDTETMWGDTNSIYVLDDWRPVGAVVLPHGVEIRKDDGVYADLQYTEITVNDPAALAIFDIPADASAQADEVVAANGDAWVPLQWVPVADSVFHAVAFSHHSMVVEFPSFVVVVEGPYTEAQSLTLARLIEQNIGKPIRYVVPTHPHYDHTGGVRALAAVGANVLVAAGHEAELRMIVESPHSNPPDALARNLDLGIEVGRVEVFSGMETISEDGQSLQLHEVLDIPHVAPKVLAFVPATGVLFQSDLFFGGPGPDASALATAITRLGLNVQQIVGGHGGVMPFSALQTAVVEE